MNIIYKPNKKQIENFLRVLGLCCLAFAVYNQVAKSNRDQSQELPFWLAISSVVFLAISYNMKMNKGKNLSFFQRNRVILPLLAVTILLVIFWVVTNYILFRN